MQKGKNSEPLDTLINRFSAVHGHPTPIFSKLIGPKIVSRESADVFAPERMDFASNYVVTEITNFMDLGLSPSNTTDKPKSIIVPTTIVEGLTDSSNCLVCMHGCEEFTVR